MRRLNLLTHPLLALLLIFSLSSSNCNIKWKKYKNKKYGFSINFPKEYSLVESQDDGGKTLSVQHFNEITNELYFISVFNSEDFIEVTGLDDIAIQTFAEEVDGAILETRDLACGRKEAIIGLDGKTFIFYQIEIQEDILYQIVSIHDSTNKSISMQQYFDSFKLLDKK